MRLLVLLIGLAAVALSQDCGQAVIQPFEENANPVLIVGGLNATAYSWPWVVDICISSFFHTCVNLCTGTLLSTTYVLTAASCFSGYPTADLSIYKVRVGNYDIRYDNEDMEQVIALTGALQLPTEDDGDGLAYDPTTRANDIALVQLSKAVTLNDHVKTVCLPTADDAVTADASAYVVGSGDKDLDHNGHSASYLVKQWKIPIVADMAQCQALYPIAADAKNICAGDATNTVTSHDSGDPLLIKSAASNKWFQYGVTSQYGTTAQLNLFTKVSVFCPFIQRVTGSQLCIDPTAPAA